jgi:hypothetical protein
LNANESPPPPGGKPRANTPLGYRVVYSQESPFFFFLFIFYFYILTPYLYTQESPLL